MNTTKLFFSVILGLGISFSAVSFASASKDNQHLETRKVEFATENGTVFVDRNNVCFDAKTNTLQTIDKISLCNTKEQVGTFSDRKFVCTSKTNERLKRHATYSKDVCERWDGNGASRSCVSYKTISGDLPIAVEKDVYASVSHNTDGGKAEMEKIGSVMHSLPSCAAVVVED